MRPLNHLVRAPSNIALIKYMGKSDAVANLPENPSFSMTLQGLATWVSVRAEDASSSAGSPITLADGVPEGAPSETRAPSLSAAGVQKVLRHAARVREEMGRILPEHGLACTAVAGGFALRTGNTFPEASGIASSASSFAAVTLAVALASAADSDAFGRAWARDVGLRRKLARLSRLGSGSSCRSFEGPWVQWEGEDARAIAAPAMPELAHFVLLISAEAKAVSSSEAHARVKSSPLWQGRTDRVALRLGQLRAALAEADLTALARLAWSDAWEMHSLFHTAAEPFTYWKPGTIEALQWLAPFVTGTAEAPIVTLDAGPNLHVTVRARDASLWRERIRTRLGSGSFLEDRPGQGAEVVF